MINVNSQHMAYNDFNFNFKTSSGDIISLSMYDKKEISFDKTESSSMSVQSFTLTRAYGYEFSYLGNGIDENDQKEIDEALKNIQPQLDTYLNNVKSSGIPTPKDILTTALDMRQELPEIKNETYKSHMGQSILKMFDEMIPKFFPNEDVLNSAKMLYDKLLEQFDNFQIYA